MKTKLSDHQAHEMYDEDIDSEGDVIVCGMKYLPSRVLKEVDPIAYDCGYNDYVDSLTDDYIIENVNDDEEEDN
jgi:hypothetical protein